MKNITLTLACASLLGVVSLTGSASADSVICESNSPANDSGDVTFSCVRGQRGLTLATVKEYISEEASDQYWYDGYHTSKRSDLAQICEDDGAGSGAFCYAHVMKRHPGESSSDSWETFGSSLENGCVGSDCSYEVKVIGVKCECW